MADAAIVAAWITGLLSLSGTGVTATVQLVDDRGSREVSVSQTSSPTMEKDGICVQAVDRLLDFATDHPDAVKLYAQDSDRLPRLYSSAEIASCRLDGAAVGETFPADETLTPGCGGEATPRKRPPRRAVRNETLGEGIGASRARPIPP